MNRVAAAIEEARRVLARAPDDPELVIATCAALNALAAERAPDEVGPDPAAELAAGAATRGLETAGGRDARTRAFLTINLAHALRALGAARDAEAQRAFADALALAPEQTAWWIDLARLHLWRGRFPDALAAARRGEGRAAAFAIAMAATALGDGEAACDAWRALGIPAERTPSGMPLVPGLGAVDVRVPARAPGLGDAGTAVPREALSFERVGVQPLSPCHGVVRTATYRDGPCDFGDTVLWDVTTPVTRGQTPCFPLLEVLRRGDERRFRFIARQQQAGDVERLCTQLPAGALIFVHHERISHVCARCASGEALVRHQHLPPEEHRVVYGKLIVPAGADLTEFRAALEEAQRAHPGVLLVIPELHEALGDSRKAGQAHQAWGVMERTKSAPAVRNNS